VRGQPQKIGMATSAKDGVVVEAIREQAKHLGMDLEKDKEFFWLAEESLNAKLPGGWTSRKFGKDQVYYVNRKTGVTIWEHPCDELYKKKFLAEKERAKTAETEQRGRLTASATNDEREAAGTEREIPTPNTHGQQKKNLDAAVSPQLVSKKGNPNSMTAITRNNSEVQHGEKTTSSASAALSDDKRLVQLPQLSKVLRQQTRRIQCTKRAFDVWQSIAHAYKGSDKVALEHMKEVACLEEELCARDLLIEQLTINLKSQENACTALLEDHMKLQEKIDTLTDVKEGQTSQFKPPTNGSLPRANQYRQSLRERKIPIAKQLSTSHSSVEETDWPESSVLEIGETHISTVPSTPGVRHVIDAQEGRDGDQDNPVEYDNGNLEGELSTFDIPSEPLSINGAQLEKLFSIYATEQHIRKSDGRERGGLIFAVEKEKDIILETPKTLSSLRFMRMLRDSKAMDARLSAAQVDIVFRRAIFGSLRKNSDQAEETTTPTRKRLRFPEFFAVVRELARKKYLRPGEVMDEDVIDQQDLLWMSQFWKEFLFPLLQRHEDRGRTRVMYPAKTPTPGPVMTPIAADELRGRNHQALLDLVDQELVSVEGAYGEAERVSKIEDLDRDIWDDINEEEGPMGLLAKYESSLRELFESHASHDIQYSKGRGGGTSFAMGHSEFLEFCSEYNILGDLLSRVAIDNLFQRLLMEGAPGNLSDDPPSYLTFNSFLYALVYCAYMAYRELAAEGGAGEIDAVYRIMFRIDPSGKRFKSLRKRYQSFQEKKKRAEISQGKSCSPREISHYSPSDSPKVLSKKKKIITTIMRPLMRSPRDGSVRSNLDADTQKDNFDLREEDKEDAMQIIREVFNHFATRPKHNNEKSHGQCVLTMQMFTRVVRAARLVDIGSQSNRLPIDLTTLDIVFKRVNLQSRSEPHRMSFDAFTIALCRIARFKYVYVPEQWIEENEMPLFDDASRTFAKDMEALRRLVVDHIIPLGNHLRAQNSDGTKTVVLATEETLSFVSLETLAKQASKLAVSFHDDKQEK
jgi:hypothetical protein